MSQMTTRFGERVLQLRKERGWSQPELGKRVGTSATMISRYERGEMTPSIEVAFRIAKAFGVTLDGLVSDEALPDALGDRAMLERWRRLDALPAAERDRILDVLDRLARDAQAQEAYAKAS